MERIIKPSHLIDEKVVKEIQLNKKEVESISQKEIDDQESQTLINDKEVQSNSQKNMDNQESQNINSGINSLPQPLGASVFWLEKNSSFLMVKVFPIIWCILFLYTMNRDTIINSYGVLFLGIASASLANAVPVGGGIVFVPILSWWGFKLTLGASYALATMTFGNGIFGFLSWLKKDSSAIAWHIIPWAVVPAWIGATVTTFHPLLTPIQCRHLFALFCIGVATVVGRGIWLYGEPVPHKPFSILNNGDGPQSKDVMNVSSSLSLKQRVLASCFSFIAGLILVAHIGIGNAMTTFLVGNFVWRLNAKSAVVTGIICGGWTSLVPFLIHLIILRDVPIELWVMGLPGVFIGAKIAPTIHEKLGIVHVLSVFVIFLLITASLMILK